MPALAARPPRTFERALEDHGRERRRVGDMGLVIVFANQKGGVGKTTAAANLGPALAERGCRVLLLDLDPQANLTESFAAERSPTQRVENLLLSANGATLAGAALEVGERLALVPASDALADAAEELAARPDYERRFPELIAAARRSYDFILIDSPPGIGPWSAQALLVADWVVVPAQPSDLDVMSAGKMCDFLEQQVRQANPGVRLLGVLLQQADRRLRLHAAAHRAFEAQRIPLLPVEIPRGVAAREAVRQGAPLFMLRPDHRISCAYRQLAALVLDTCCEKVAA